MVAVGEAVGDSHAAADQGCQPSPVHPRMICHLGSLGMCAATLGQWCRLRLGSALHEDLESVQHSTDVELALKPWGSSEQVLTVPASAL